MNAMRVAFVVYLAGIVVATTSASEEQLRTDDGSEAVAAADSRVEELLSAATKPSQMTATKSSHTTVVAKTSQTVTKPSITAAPKGKLKVASHRAATTQASARHPVTVDTRVSATGKAQQVRAKAMAKAKADKKTLKKKVHLAERFHTIVKKVGVLLDGAMHKLTGDTKLFNKAVHEGNKKQQILKVQAKGAKQRVKQNAAKMVAIKTHMALAQRDSAQALLLFARKFRKSAKASFWSSYKMAAKHHHKLHKLYKKIVDHVSKMKKAMVSSGDHLLAMYITGIKKYYKAKYRHKYNPGYAKLKPAQRLAAKHSIQTAKLVMKKARTRLAKFKHTSATARRHAKKLGRGLQHTFRKLRFLFQKARTSYREAMKHFHPTYSMRAAAEAEVYAPTHLQPMESMELPAPAAPDKAKIQAVAKSALGAGAVGATNAATNAAGAAGNDPVQASHKKAKTATKATGDSVKQEVKAVTGIMKKVLLQEHKQQQSGTSKKKVLATTQQAIQAVKHAILVHPVLPEI